MASLCTPFTVTLRRDVDNSRELGKIPCCQCIFLCFLWLIKILQSFLLIHVLPTHQMPFPICYKLSYIHALYLTNNTWCIFCQFLNPIHLFLLVYKARQYYCKDEVTLRGLSLRGGGWGVTAATVNVAPGYMYFHRKIEEKYMYNQNKSLHVAV